MIEYPEIPRQIIKSFPVYVFDKIDGSNIRTEWNLKRGFSKFGSRHELIDPGHFLGESIELINEQFAQDLDKIFRKMRLRKVTAFFEYWGRLSFAGSHYKDEEHFVTLIDINIDKQGFISPQDFVKNFGHLNCAKCLYRGRINEEFIRKVKDGELEGMTREGVVCKAKVKNRQYMFKIKNNIWIDMLRDKCGNNETLFRQLL